MKIKVEKRNGEIVDYNRSKIALAIYKAISASHTQEELKDNYNEDILNNIVDEIEATIMDTSNHNISTDKGVEMVISTSVEQIQDLVERFLIKSGYADTAKEYILYRQKRNEIRNTKDSISKTISNLFCTESKDNDLKRDNGNIDGDSPMGTMLQVGSNVSKNFYLQNMMSKDIAKAYEDGYIHIHDLDFYSLTLTCCQIDCLKLFKGGFNTGHGHLREPNSIGSYATLAAIAIQSNQNDQHGGQSIPNFDYSMAPGIYKSFRKAWKRNVEKAIEFGLLNKDDFKDIPQLSDDFIESILDDKKDYEYFKEKIKNYPDDEQLYKIITMTKKDIENECYQAMEGFVHNLNTLHSRAGAQVNYVA